MLCPKCDEKQYCPCENCAVINKDQVTWVWHDDGETSSCGHCGFRESADGWLDIMYSQITEE